MRARLARVFVAAAAAWALLACNGEGGGATADTGADTFSDATPDSAPDGTSDAAPDIVIDVAPDAAPDAAVDAAPDAAIDAAPDALDDGASDALLDATPDAGDAADTTPDASGPPPSDRYRNVLATEADFLFVALQGETKWLAPVAGRTPPAPLGAAACWFQNMHLAEWHLQFLRGFAELAGLAFEDYVRWVVDPEARVLWGGALAAFPSALHPETGEPGIYAWTLYTDQNRPDALAPADVPTVHDILRTAAPFAADRLVFAVHGDGQKAAAALLGPGWTAAGVPWVTPEQLGPGR